MSWNQFHVLVIEMPKNPKAKPKSPGGIFAGIGIAMPLFNTPIVVLFQSTVDSAFMGRVFSVFTMTSSVLMPLAMLVFGPVSDTVAIDVLLIGTGIVITILCIPFVASKTLREAGRSHS